MSYLQHLYISIDGIMGVDALLVGYGVDVESFALKDAKVQLHYCLNIVSLLISQVIPTNFDLMTATGK